MRGCFIDDLTQCGFDLQRVFFRDHPAVKLEAHAAWHNVGVGATFNRSNVQVRMCDALDLGGDLFVHRVLSVQRRQNFVSRLQRVNPRLGNGSMRHLAVHGDFHLQAAVVCGDDLVAKACGDHQIRLDDVVFEQPCRSDFAAKLFVIGKEQLHTTVSGFGDGFKRAHGKRVS